MGYFPNGTAGMCYEAEYCARCVHGRDEDKGCPVMAAHMLHNYRDCNDDSSILHILIPRTADKLGNEKCTMFVRASKIDEAVEKADRRRAEAYERWKRSRSVSDSIPQKDEATGV